MKTKDRNKTLIRVAAIISAAILCAAAAYSVVSTSPGLGLAQSPTATPTDSPTEGPVLTGTPLAFPTPVNTPQWWGFPWPTFDPYFYSTATPTP